MYFEGEIGKYWDHYLGTTNKKYINKEMAIFGKREDNEGIINDDLYDRLNELRKLLNCAKHDTDPNRDNTFDSEDAIIFYFETRIIGNELLKILNHPTCNIIYDIDDDF